MQKNLLVDLISYPSALHTIHNIKITKREIDVIACVVNRRVSDTSISDQLGINKRTVETHLRNITQKLNCTTRKLREVIEQSGQADIYLQHYNMLVLSKHFQFIIDQAKPLIVKRPAYCRFFYTDTSIQTVLDKVRSSLKYLEIESSIEVFDDSSAITTQDKAQNFLIFNSSYTTAPFNFSGVCLDYLSYGTIFDFILDILKKSVQDDQIIQLLEKFNSKTVTTSVDSKPLETLPSSRLFSADTKKNGLLNKKASLWWGFCGVLIVFLGVIVWFDKERLNATYNIRSELPLPKPSLLLQRSSLLNSIQTRLYSSLLNDNISTVALCGIGGAGKTTIARMIGRQHKGIVWELNAETETTLKTSMHSFAYTLAQTTEDRARLNFIFNLRNTKEQERQICLFAGNKLVNNPGWLLIFDNVESFGDIKDYFPTDPGVWGAGHILITSRNCNFQYIEHDNIITIDALSKKESIELFAQTRYFHAHLANEDNKNIDDFLEKIPAFPLDIVMAANFLQQSHLSYEQYLECLHNNNFQSDQPSALKASVDYNQTRHDIISVSLNPLLANPKFVDLLVFIAFLDSQNISIDMLRKLAGDAATHKLLYELRKYSLVSSESLLNDEKVFSMHRSIQSNLCNYIFAKLTINEIHRALEKSALAFEIYANELVDVSDYQEISRLITHAENLMRHSKLPTFLKEIVNVSYAHLLSALPSYPQKVVPILEKSIQLLEKTPVKKAPDLLRLAKALSILGDRYRSLCLFSQAEKSLAKSTSIFQQLAPSSIDAAKAYVRFGTLNRVQGNYAKTQELYLKALKIYNTYPSVYHPLDKLISLGLNERDMGNYKQAIEYLETNLNHVNDKNDFWYFWTLSYLGTVYLDTGQYDKAWKCFQTSEDFIKKQSKSEAEGIPYAWRLAYMGATQSLQGSPIKALDILERSYHTFEKISQGKEMHGVCFKVVLPYMGHAYMQKGDFKKAKELYERSLKLLEKHYGCGHLQTARVICYLGILALKENRFEDAETFIQTSYKIFKKHGHTDVFLSLESLHDLFYEKYQLARQVKSIKEAEKYKTQSKDYLLEAMHIVKENLPAVSAHFKRIQTKMERK